ncbi:MAG: hypothetical protein IH965_13810 [Gemmatimonadetes bacterium]|nr:hypothetical protein [Gemmatimonadota bacterium]
MCRLAAALVLIVAPSIAAAQQDPFVGTFTNGQITLQLTRGTGGYSGVARLQGQQFQITAQRSGNTLNGSYSYQGQTFPLSIAVQGEALIMYVDGQAVELYRQGARMAVPAQPSQPSQPSQPAQPSAGATPQAGQLSAQGQEWAARLAGKRLTQMESYSSGSSGGYSNKQVWDLCRDGRFFFYGESMVSVDVGGAFGAAGGPERGGGQWRIIEQGGLVGIELRWLGGRVSQHTLDYQNGQTYADGTRVFVTDANSSCY